MPSTTRYRRGDIVLVSFPFTDLSSSKRCPALVLSPDAFNERGEDLVLVAITSQQPADQAVGVEPDDFSDGALPTASYVKVAKIFTMHSTLVLKRICALRHEKLADVLQELRSFFS
ncbi:MAG: type II toxin-antitoxin system PemK/MazF family toxin [Vicinamibacterales bacterium]